MMDRNTASKPPGEQSTGPVTEQNHSNVTDSDKGPTEIGSQDRGPGVSHRNAQDGLVPPVFVGAHSSLADFYAGLYDPNTYSDITLNLLGPDTNPPHTLGNSNGSNRPNAPLSTQAYQHQQEPPQTEDNFLQPITQNWVDINQFDQVNPAYSQWAQQGTQSAAPSVIRAQAAQPVQTYVHMTEPDIVSAYPDLFTVPSQSVPETAESGNEGNPDMDWASLVEQLGINFS
jgi:hypothetical protein